MNISDQQLKEILSKQDYLTIENLQKAEEFAKINNISFIEYLISHGLLTKTILGQAIAEAFKIPYADLNVNPPTYKQVLKIPEQTSKKYKVVFYKEEQSGVFIATDNPNQPGLIEELQNLFQGKKIIVAYALTEFIEASFIHYRQKLETRFASIIKEQKKIAPEIIREIFEDAISYKASDIHFEPQENDVIIRFRIDGMLQEVGHLQKIYYENIINRIKVQAHLKIDEHNASQDGSLSYKKGTKKIDMRVSIAPILDGEKIVIRILTSYISTFALNDIGLSEQNKKILNKAVKKPIGMILATGPTGAGKTTTLYALLKIINRRDINITTIEDPVEYKIGGINQIQVNEQTELTFAKGLRSIVRQDPDIILVGEIRDQETAEIGVNAALTGHLLLSTFHSNDAATSIPRLLDMGIEPFLLASTLETIIAQRLIRKICDSCKVSKSQKKEELIKISSEVSKYFSEDVITTYLGKGCNECGDTGYNGRTAIYEVINITPEMKNLILKNPPTKQIWELAQKQGSISLFQDGIEKVRNGITTIEEVLRVASPTLFDSTNE